MVSHSQQKKSHEIQSTVAPFGHGSDLTGNLALGKEGPEPLCQLQKTGLYHTVAKQPLGLDFGSCSYENKRAGVPRSTSGCPRGSKKRHPESAGEKDRRHNADRSRGLRGRSLDKEKGSWCHKSWKTVPSCDNPSYTGRVWVTGWSTRIDGERRQNSPCRPFRWEFPGWVITCPQHTCALLG